MLFGIIGALGAGKTLLLTALLNALRDNYMIVTNYWTRFSDEIMNAEEMLLRIGEFKHKTKKQKAFGIDELGTILKALEFYSDENEFLTDIARKSRKKHTDIYYTSQHIMMVDRNIRRITDVFIHVKCNEEQKKISAQNYHCDGINVFEGEDYTLKNIDRYFAMFDTEEVIEPDRTCVLNYFVELTLKNEELLKDLAQVTKKNAQVDIIRFHLKCSAQLAKMILLRLQLE